MTTIPTLAPEALAQRYALLCESTRPEPDEHMLAYSVEQGLQALDKLLAHDLRTLARQGAPDDFADIHQALLRELERLREFCAFPALANKLVVAFGGGFSAGKSSLINALLGQKLLVTEVDPTTSLPTYLLHGSSNQVSALNLFGHRVALSEEAFLSLTHDEALLYGSHISRLLRAAFITRTDFAWLNLALIDTPGYSKDQSSGQTGAHSERTDEHIARAQLNAAQAVVWVIDARQGCITEDDLAFLGSLQRNIPLFIALSRADQKPEAEIPGILSVISAALKGRNIPVVGIAPMSARKPQSWPLMPLLSQFSQWNKQRRQLSFAQNFYAEFTRYVDFLDDLQHQSLRHMNRLNRILVLADSKNVQDDATELKQAAETQLQSVKKSREQLLELQNKFFIQLGELGKLVGIDLPGSIAQMMQGEGKSADLLQILIDQRKLQKKSLPDEPQILHELMHNNQKQKLTQLSTNVLADLLRAHGAAGLDEYGRICYARLLVALLIGAAEITAKQSQFLLLILNRLGFEDVRSELFDWVKSIQESDFLEARDVILENKLERSLILDALILCSFDRALNSKQIQLLSEMADGLRIHDELNNSLVSLARYALGFVDVKPKGDVETSSFVMWTLLLPHADGNLRASIASDRNLPQYLQAVMASDQNDDVVAALASNPALTEKIITDLAANGSAKVKNVLAKHKALPKKLQEQFFSVGDDDLKTSLASNESISLDLQKRLSQESYWRIKAGLGSNLSIDARLMDVVAKDQDAYVRASLASNPKINLKLMTCFLEDGERRVRAALAENIAIPESIQKKLQGETDQDIRMKLAKNPGASEAVLNGLLADTSSVKVSLARNPKLSIGLQRTLISRGEIEIMVNVHQNEAAAEEVKIAIESSISKDDLSHYMKQWGDKTKESFTLLKESMAAEQVWSNYAMKQFQDTGWFSSWSQSECDRLEGRAKSIDRQIKQVEEEITRLDSVCYLLRCVLKEKEARIPKNKANSTNSADAATNKNNSQPGDILSAGSGFPELVMLPGGSFQMGSILRSDEQPVHTVHITSFAMGKYPVTQGQWKQVMGNNPSRFSSGGDQCPVENVSWDDAQAFIQKLNQQTGHTYRLPSEAEWEYACRAGSTGKWCFGDDESQLKHYAWYDDNSGRKTHPVGERKANAFGLHDMHGNVREWCEDLWHDNYQGAPSDGRAWVDGRAVARLLRGGSWYHNNSIARAADRCGSLPDNRNDVCGFRVARTAP